MDEGARLSFGGARLNVTASGIASDSALRRIRPLETTSWAEFIDRHPRASVFHAPAWLEALRRTYGYQAQVFTASPDSDPIREAIVFCQVDSWLTGRRLVSLPFSDHCDPLVNNESTMDAMVSALQSHLSRDGLSYLEIRAARPFETLVDSHSTYSYCRHEIDLAPDVNIMFRNCHKSSTQRKITRANREGLSEETGRSPELLDDFYRLLLLTRRRHSVPPQPKRWFQNLIDCFGHALTIRVAKKDRQPIAAILTLVFKDTLVYKYGCSDASFHALGGMHFLFWKAICQAKEEGFRRFDLGRSEWHEEGLVSFKDRWGASRSVLNYSRFCAAGHQKGAFGPARAGWKERLAKQVFAHLPDRALGLAGELLYRHVG
jgi:lipid II:glycine glycyltransferase (peptidoglycan interpeptide bridge formation enzyme)